VVFGYLQSANQQAALNVFPAVLSVGDTNMTARNLGATTLRQVFFFHKGAMFTHGNW